MTLFVRGRSRDFQTVAVQGTVGWHVVDQELLEFLTQDEQAFTELPASAREWAHERLDLGHVQGKLVVTA